MGKIKIGLVILASITLVGLILTGLVLAQDPLAGKLIALDAGHGGDSLGAQYPAKCADDGDPSDCQVYEKDVNLAVVYALEKKLEADNNGDSKPDNQVVLTRVCDETISSRKSRVDMAIEECKSIDGRKCDVLVSVHHNGSTEPEYDGLLVIYNEKQDKPLAIALHDTLWESFSSTTPNYVDKGLDNGGYGMTVFGHLVSALTEAYYITNDWEATQYLSGQPYLPKGCDKNGNESIDEGEYTVLTGTRITQEADALYDGLVNYFSAPPPKPDNRK